ncbi:MAG: GDP-mannose 4,6-dehydratase [Ectothiorhodospiraceae bacterium]|nr:GDP-mannose 4,6-dehydratase [Ectothiorhodospiraceae bacterium]
MRYLVTGGCGFVGSHLVEHLHAAGHEVSVIDDLSTGRYDNVAHLEGRPRFELVVGSVLDPSLLRDAVRGVDAVFHLASVVGVRLVMEQPVNTIRTIFQGTEAVLREASTFRRPVLLASTSEVYGKSDDVPFREDGDRLEGPTHRHRWAYACAKALDEFLALAHWKETRLPVVVARLFNTVGPRQSGRYGMVVPRFVEQALAGEPLLVHGDGTQTRCFTHVADVVECMAALLACPAAHGEVVNVGSAEAVSIGDLARRVVALAESAAPVRLVPYSAVYGEGFEDMRARLPDIDKARRLVGWSPRRDLDTTLREIIAWHRNHRRGA